MKLIKRYGDALAQVISVQPDEVTDLPAYFRGVEEQFVTFNLQVPFGKSEESLQSTKAGCP